MFFSIQLGFDIIPTDEIILFRGVGIPPTSLTLIGDVKHSLNGRIIRRFHGKMFGGTRFWPHVMTEFGNDGNWIVGNHPQMALFVPMIVRWMMKNWLVVTGTMEFYDFPIILGISSSQLTKSIIFQRGRLKPPTSYNSARNPKFLKLSQFVGLDDWTQDWQCLSFGLISRYIQMLWINTYTAYTAYTLTILTASRGCP